MSRHTIRLPLLAVLGLSCATETRDVETTLFGDGTVSGPPGSDDSSGTPADSSGASASMSGTADSGSDGGIKLDVGAAEASATMEGGDGTGCAKADFLFVIDNSGSMADEQDRQIRNCGLPLAHGQQVLAKNASHTMPGQQSASLEQSSVNC